MPFADAEAGEIPRAFVELKKVRRLEFIDGMRQRALVLLTACWSSLSCLAQAAEECASLTPADSEDTLIVWNSGSPALSHRGPDEPWETKLGPLRVIAVVDDGAIRPPRNAAVIENQALSNVLDPAQEIVLTEIHPLNFLARPGDSYCLFSAEADLSNVATHALFSSDPEFRLRAPDDTEQALFDESIYPITYCTNRAGMFLRDVPPEDVPPCAEPQLIGMSDLDADSIPEFWATDVSRYSTGIAVWERGPRGYVRLFSACPGCGD